MTSKLTLAQDAPKEVLESIFLYLNPYAALICEQVCVRWRIAMMAVWQSRFARLESAAQKFSLEAFGHLIKSVPVPSSLDNPSGGNEQLWWAQLKRIIILEDCLDKIHQCQMSKKEYQFRLSSDGLPSIGGRHVCGPYLLIINLVSNNVHSNDSVAEGDLPSVNAEKLKWTAQSVTPNSGSEGVTSSANQRKLKRSAIWQLNIYYILTGKLIKTIPNINMVQPCIAGCCFDDSQYREGGNEGGGNSSSSDNGGIGNSNLFSLTFLKRAANKGSKDLLNPKISAIVLFERDKATTQSKIVVVKAPFASGAALAQTATASVQHPIDATSAPSHASNAPQGTPLSDHNNSASNTGYSSGLREYFFSTEFKKSQSTIRVFDHLLVATFRHEERTQTELQVHHILDMGRQVREWKRWIVPEQVWRVEFKDENVFALACRTKVLFFDVLHGSYQTIYSSTHIPKTRLFIGMFHVMFASDYGSKPAVILPISNQESVSVSYDGGGSCGGGTDVSPVTPQSPSSPSCVRSLAFPSVSYCGLESSHASVAGGSKAAAVMIDSIKWRDLSFKSASIGSTVLVDSPDDNMFTVMNLDYPTVRLDYPHPNINTRDCELCGISVAGHHLLVVLRNFKQNYCHVVKLNLLSSV